MTGACWALAAVGLIVVLLGGLRLAIPLVGWLWRRACGLGRQ